MQILAVRHNWPEREGFRIQRPKGREDYTFLHFHNPMHFVLEGKDVFTRAGACMVFAPGVPQYFDSAVPVTHNWFHADAAFGQMLSRYEIPVNTVFYPGATDFISRLCQKIEVEFYSRNLHKEDLMAGFVGELLIRLSRSLEGHTPGGVSFADRQKLSGVRQQILSQPEKRWTVPQMAELANLSPSRFHAVYKRLFATSPMQDLLDAKMGFAQTLLLRQPELKIPDIAERLGYTEQYHFIRIFKSVVGVSPGRYRIQNNIFEKR